MSAGVRTGFGFALDNLLDEPGAGVSAWMRTTAGVVALLLAVQFTTGLLLAFFYVPSAESAHATVAYVEKVLDSGPWVRALHLYASQLLPLALLSHLAQSFWRGAHRRKPFGWAASVLLLGLVMAGGGTGYSLPWDARAFYSTRVAENLAAGLPLVGGRARAWLLGGGEISTLTVSRFYALHALVIPALILLITFARLFVAREPGPGGAVTERPRGGDWVRAQLARNAVVAGAVFLALALWASKFPAPLGPPAEAAPAGYVPRPGAQFLWLFQLLKYFSKTTASLVALVAPALILAALALLPFLGRRETATSNRRLSRALGLAGFASVFALVAAMTLVALNEDSLDPRVSGRLAEQARQEEEFRRSPFVPLKRGGVARDSGAGTAAPSSTDSVDAPPPEAYTRNCARCHGPRGEGKGVNPPLVGVSKQPQRTVEDIVRILHDPASYNLERRMPSFARKLTEDEKRAVAEWVVSLK